MITFLIFGFYVRFFGVTIYILPPHFFFQAFPHDANVNLKLSKIKPLHAEWLVKVYTDMQNRGSLIKKGFQKAGITDALTLSMDYLMNENPFDEDDMRY